jgi:hypothetical protein
VVDDEADVFTQALGTRAVAIARHDEHGGAADGGGDLVFAPSVQLQMVGVTAKPGLRPVEQFVRGLLGPREQPLRRVSPAAAEQAAERAVRRLGGRAVDHREQRVIPALGGASESAASTHACHVPSATQITTGMPSV